MPCLATVFRSFQRALEHLFKHIRLYKGSHSLFLLRCTLTMFKGEILQCSSHLILLCQQQDVIVELKGIEYTQVYANGNSRRTFLNASNCERRASSTFRYLCYTKITTQTGQLDLLANKYSIYIYEYKITTFSLFYDRL